MKITNGKTTLQTLALAANRTASFHLYDVNNSQRLKAEEAVKRIFRTAYGADISYYLPFLLTAEINQRVAAVVGIRSAIAQPLFLEQYLNCPIETSIKNINGLDISRKNIAEIGNLVSCKTGISRQLFIVLAFALAQANIEWVSFTATTQVEQVLAKLSLQPVIIGQASEASLANGNGNWGSYYVDKPNVCIGNVYNAVHELKKSIAIREMTTKLEPTISQLAQQLSQQIEVDS